MKVQKQIIIIVVCLLVTISTIFISVNAVQVKKSDNHLELGMKYLEEGNYSQAILEFQKSIEISARNTYAEEMIELLNQYKAFDELYEDGNFQGALEIIEKLQAMNKFEIIKDVVIVKGESVQSKIEVNKEVDGLEEKINALISNNEFDEALKILNECLAKDLTDDYKQKVNGLIEKINQAKEVYEAEQKRLEEEAKKAEEEKKKQEQQNRQLTPQECGQLLTDKGYQIFGSDAYHVTVDGRLYYWVYIAPLNGGDGLVTAYVDVNTGAYNVDGTWRN